MECYPDLWRVGGDRGIRSMRVLLTGATGYIADQLLAAFRERYDLRLLDVREEDGSGRRVEGIEVADLLVDDRSKLEPYFADAEVVVHTGHRKPVGTDTQSQYDVERTNVDMMQRVYQLSLECGVRRVVAASTNQAAKWYEQPYFAGLKDRVSPEDYPRPDSFYGWAKAAYEPLGFLYACGSLGRKLEVVQIRIVVPREIDASLLEDEYGVPFHIFYGVSDNARKFWSITNARKVIRYEPADDSEVRFAEDIARLLHRKEF